MKVYSVNDFCMTDYWGDTSSTSGMVTTDKIQKVFLSSSQTVNKVWVAEGDSVRKGDKLISYDSTLTQASVEQAKIDYDRQDESLTTAKNELEYLKKAKNKETLKQELDKLNAELDALKKKYDEDPDHLYNGDAPVTEGAIKDYKKAMTVKGADGSDQTVNVQYYNWLSTSRLNDSKVTEILTNLATLRADRADKDHPSVDTYVVLVQRYEDKVGGYVDNTVGLVCRSSRTPSASTMTRPSRGSSRRSIWPTCIWKTPWSRRIWPRPSWTRRRRSRKKRSTCGWQSCRWTRRPRSWATATCMRSLTAP